jgi:sec-independent protein translocase protein TatA
MREKRCYARRMPGWIGPWELAILLVVVLLVFGPKRLPEMGKSLGKGMREFKNSITGKDDERPHPAELTASVEEERLPAAHRERDTVG